MARESNSTAYAEDRDEMVVLPTVEVHLCHSEVNFWISDFPLKDVPAQPTGQKSKLGLGCSLIEPVQTP